MHEHPTPAPPCPHPELKHCAKCDVVYCTGCELEWAKKPLTARDFQTATIAVPAQSPPVIFEQPTPWRRWPEDTTTGGQPPPLATTWCSTGHRK